MPREPHRTRERFAPRIVQAHSKSVHTAIGQFCICTVYRSCSIIVVRSPSTGTFNAHLNCFISSTCILKCPIPLWADLAVHLSPAEGIGGVGDTSQQQGFRQPAAFLSC